jgi:hypothetical protein
MKSTTCVFVRNLTTRRVVHHEIDEIDSDEVSPSEQAKIERRRIQELMTQYPPSEFEVFAQGFDSRNTLYSIWPELRSDESSSS